MRLLLTTFFTIFLSVFSMDGFAQSAPSTTVKADTAGARVMNDPFIPQPDDEEFNLFLLTLAIAFFSIVVGIILVGSVIVTLFLLLLLAMVSTGMLSPGILTGLHRKSETANFRTVLVLACCIGGVLGGAICFWQINRIFEIDLTASTAALTGALSGLLGGFLLGFALAGIIRAYMNYCRQKLSF